MIAISGSSIPRHLDAFALAVTTLAVMAAVVVPASYAVVVVAACTTAAVAAPGGRRGVAALAVWAPISVAVVLGVAVVG